MATPPISYNRFDYSQCSLAFAVRRSRSQAPAAPGSRMKASRFHLSTQKEAPADAEIVSHRLMTRAGMIRKVAGGIYTYMPLGLRVVRKIEAIVRDEMNRAGAIELL